MKESVFRCRWGDESVWAVDGARIQEEQALPSYASPDQTDQASTVGVVTSRSRPRRTVRPSREAVRRIAGETAPQSAAADPGSADSRRQGSRHGTDETTRERTKLDAARLFPRT